jgi:hypothetical protein
LLTFLGEARKVSAPSGAHPDTKSARRRKNRQQTQTTTGSGSNMIPNRSYTLVWIALASVMT